MKSNILFDEYFSMFVTNIQRKYLTHYQDHLYHPESTVFSHSRLVALLLPNTPTMQMCALLHDIGKLSCTQVHVKHNTLRIQNIGHAEISNNCIEPLRKYLFNEIKDIDWECVHQVTYYHMRMHDYNDNKIKKSEKRKAMEELKYFKELSMFSTADKNGVGSSESMLPYVVVTVGMSGSGKSTWRKSFITEMTEGKTPFIAICPDDLRKELTGDISNQTKNNEVWDKAFSILDYYICNKQNVVFDSTCTNLDTMKRILRHCQSDTKHKAIVIFKIFNVDIDTCKCRVNDDILHGVDRSKVPMEVIDRQYEGYKKVVDWIKSNDKLIME